MVLNFARWVLLAAVALAGWFHYRGALASVMLLLRDLAADNMAHVWLIPLISVVVVCLRRREFRDAAGLPSWRGFGWVLGFLALAYLGASGGHGRVSQISMIGLIWSVPYALWGRGIGSLMLFPAWVLLFTVPVALDDVILLLRKLAAAASVDVLSGLGMPVSRSGTDIIVKTPGSKFTLDVADPCSGIRVVFSMMSLIAVYAHLILKSRLQRWMLLACSIPIAVLSNIVRIFFVCWVACAFGKKVALGFFHDYSGYVIFLIAVLMVLATERLTEKPAAWLAGKWQRIRGLPAHDTATDASPESPQNPQEDKQQSKANPSVRGRGKKRSSR